MEEASKRKLEPIEIEFVEGSGFGEGSITETEVEPLTGDCEIIVGFGAIVIEARVVVGVRG
jgi:hypothetical protein